MNSIILSALIIFLTSQVNRLLPARVLSNTLEVPRNMMWGVLIFSLLIGALIFFLSLRLLGDIVIDSPYFEYSIIILGTLMFAEKVWTLWTVKSWPDMPSAWSSLLYAALAFVLVVPLVATTTWGNLFLGIILGNLLVVTVFILDHHRPLEKIHYRWWEVLSSIPLSILIIKALM